MGDVSRPAFGELVRRYQDMACACAYGILGNFHLAEEAAQEAFLLAWQKLDELRDPRAFPGWLRAIVLSQCHRLTRGRRIHCVPIDGSGIEAPVPDPEALLARREQRDDVLALVRTLPDGERDVCLLYYMAGYSQGEIAACLGLRPSAVGKRLFSARRKLKARALSACADRLKAARPSRSRAFRERVHARLRPLAPRDWTPVGALAHLTHAGDPDDCELWLRDRRRFAGRHHRQYVVERAGTGEIVAYGAIEQSIYLPRYRLFLVVDPAHVRRGAANRLLDRLFADLRALDAVTVSFTFDAARTDLLSLLDEYGFRETDRVCELRLTPGGADRSWIERARAQAAGAGVRIVTLADERRRDESSVERLHDLTTALALEHGGRRVAPPRFDMKEARIWLEQPYVLADAFFIAIAGAEYVGVGGVRRGAVPAQLQQSETAVLAGWRRKGIGLALNAAAIAYAAEHGYAEIRASVDARSRALLALNEKSGFRARGGRVTVERFVRAIVRVGREVFAQYVGRYRGDAARPGFVVSVTNEDGRLFAEFIGQKVELFPESATSFFIKHFYGRAEFVRDATGRATRVLWRERARSNKEVCVCLDRIG